VKTNLAGTVAVVTGAGILRDRLFHRMRPEDLPLHVSADVPSRDPI
jgi:hypothetical protein